MTEHNESIRNWRKSSYSSGGNGSCVEVGVSAHGIAIRDTKDRAGGALRFETRDWSFFTQAL